MSPLLHLLLPGVLFMLCSCVSSEPNRNPRAGLGHPRMADHQAQEWPAPGQCSDQPAIPHGLLFPAQGEARATLLCLHGIQTHAVWFAPLADILTKNHFNVVALDRRGSGMNTTGSFVKGHADGPKELLDDLMHQIDVVEKDPKLRHTPLYLVGTSWGSNVATVYVSQRKDQRIKGVIQLVPATRSFFEKPGQAFFASIASAIAPCWARKLPFGPNHYQPGNPQPRPRDHGPERSSVNESAPLPLPDPELANWLAVDNEEDRSRQIRPVSVNKPSVRLLHTGLSLARDWRKAHEPLPVPLLVIVAERDQIMDNQAAWTAAVAHAPRHHLEVIPGAGHGAQITHPDLIAKYIVHWVHRP